MIATRSPGRRAVAPRSALVAGMLAAVAGAAHGADWHVDGAPLQLQPGSSRQPASQPSPGSCRSSSHSSGGTTKPSPQIAGAHSMPP